MTPEQLADQLAARQAGGLWYRSDEAAAELRRLAAENAQLLETLHHISLCSQNSMGSQRQCGEIARAAIKAATGETK